MSASAVMQPFSPNEAVHFWEGVAAAVGRSETVLLAAEVDGRIVGTVQLGVGTMAMLLAASPVPTSIRVISVSAGVVDIE